MSDELKSLIEQAIRQEELSHEFYSRLAGIVTHGETKETLDAFGTAHECEGKTFEDVLNKIVRFLNQ